METKRARKKTDTEWDLHRHTIEEKYRTKQLEGEDGVIEIMKNNHGFLATYIPPLTYSDLY
jgi:hypothetical protein